MPEPTHEEARASLEFAKKPHKAGQGLRTIAGKWEQAANRQQRALVNAYDGWGRGIRRKLRRAALAGAPTGELVAITETGLGELSVVALRYVVQNQ